MGGGALSNIFKKLFANTADDVASKVASQYGDDVIRNLATSSADDIAAKSGNLIATHQLTADKLKGAADLGGFVQPSMAVVDPSKATNFLPGSDFGDIVMVANRDAVNPASKAAKTFIGDRDIYSPRFPSSSYQLNTDALDDILKQTPGISKQSAISNMGLDDEAIYSPFLQDVYRKNNPAVADLATMDLRKMPEFAQFADDMQGQLRGDRMLDYRTPSGNYKSLPATAENANTIMNKTGAVGTEAGYQGAGTMAYQQNTNKIKSLDDLYKNRYRLVDNVTGEQTKQAMNDELARITANLDELKLPAFQSDNPYTQFDNVSNYVADAASNQRNLYPALDELPDNIVNDIGRMQQAYKQVPVSYFEAKPRRVVGGNEFYGAYVPETAPQEVIDQLNQLGVNNINRYTDAGDLDLSLAQLAKQGKRGISPYVLGLGGILPAGGILGALLNGGNNDQQPMV